MKITELNDQIEKFLKDRGAIKVGFNTLETLAGGPPSTDITYILESAKSAITFALLFDKEKIRDYLAKRDFSGHEDDRAALNDKGYKIAKELASWLEEKGYKSKGLIPNNKYRQEIPGWELKLPPPISHRYLAVRSGVGSFGWSGNVGIKGIGTTILLGSVVTEAELTPTDPLPPEEQFCTRCKICTKVCGANLFDKEELTTVTIGGKEFSYSRRRNYIRCFYVCGGLAGYKEGRSWSTWSPGRFPIPDYDDESEEKTEKAIMTNFIRALSKYKKWPKRKDFGEFEGYQNTALPGYKLRLTCGLCQNICFGDSKETAKNYQILQDSGCIIQKENGDILVLPADEAQKVFEEMDRKHKRLYEFLKKKQKVKAPVSN
ncbi:MAG: epoxyqueuosine reductase [Candidatus Lokiarchaeota archaeon]|nr:epoxyqueuosine reductase [Candidatus Lokiarchaeota archaeon]